MPSETSHHCLSLLSRLRLFFLAGMAASALIVVLLVTLVGTFYRGELLAHKAELFADALSANLRFDATGQVVGFDETAVEPWVLTSLSTELRVRVADAQGAVRYSNGEARLLGPLAPGAADIAPDGVAMHLATRSTLHDGRRWTVQVAVTDRFVNLLRESFGAPGMRRGVLAMSAVFLLVFLASFQWLLRRSLAPLHAASLAAQRISPKALGERLDASAQPAEIRPLVQAFNQALDRLQQGFEAQQRFLASAAHELKTPLALIRAQVELGHGDETRGIVLADIDRMGRHVQQLLMLAETSEPLNYRVSPVDPRPVLEEVRSVMMRVADRRSVMLHLRIDHDVQTWNADRGALFTLLKNLLENAIQHSAAGDVVSMVATVDGCRVSDQGPGIDAEQLPRIFERFWRGADRRDEGAGLGLSICAAIVEAHGWRIVPRPLPRGLCMEVQMSRPSAVEESRATEPGLNAGALRPSAA
jgi:signal transduction histidine kinase